MRIGDRAQRRFSSGSPIELPSQPARQRPVVRRGELHEEIVLMLAIVYRFTIAQFAACEQIRIPAPANRRRLEAEHSTKTETTGTNPPLRHAHDPIDAAELVDTASAA